MKLETAAKLFLFVVTGVLLCANGASAQSVAYRQTNLSSDLPGLANHTDVDLRNPWGVAFNPGQSFFITNNNGHVIAQDATGAFTGGFIIPNPAGTGSGGAATGIAADSSSFFGGGDLVQPFITATEAGGIYLWGVDTNGDIPTAATLKVDKSQAGAVYTGLAILKPDCCAPFLAVANFHSGLVEPYTTSFDPLAPPGSFTDPSLPAGYAPFGIQTIGNQVFVLYALQGADKHDPVFGAGNGVVSIFDLEGNFVRRFATAGNLNAPWGVTKASANFGPFSNDILIGNAGDGIINAFDPATGNFAGQVKNGDGTVLVNNGLHGLAFRTDGIGDPDTLYFTAGINNGQDGLFGAITPGLVSTTRVSVGLIPPGGAAPITVTVSAGPGNTGTPTGTVAVTDGGVPIATVALTNGMIVFPAVINDPGTHVIKAQYQGDATFLPSTSTTDVDIALIPTTLTLAAPSTALSGETVELIATTASTGGVPTGEISFNDGNTNLGSAPLDGTGVARLRISTLTAGTHTFTATYPGDAKFDVSASTPVVTTVISRDFSIVAAPPSANVTAGQSTSFNITVTPSGGFTDRVTFSCPVLTGITCAFNPPTITPNGAALNTMLTVTTSAGVSRYGQAVGTMGSGGSGMLLTSLALMAMLAALRKSGRRPHALVFRVAASALTVIALALTLVSCGGYTTSGQVDRGTAAIVVTAQSGAITHTTNISVTVQ
jgi:uncharacterized protein (TIGR03118 family)